VDLATPVDLAARVDPEVRVARDRAVPAVPAIRADPGDPAIRAAPAGMNRAGGTVAAMAADTAATAPADLADTSPGAPADRATREVLVGRVDRATPGATIPVVTTPAVTTPVVTTPAHRADRVSRADTTLDRARLGRMPVHLRPVPADPRTPVDHRRDPTRAAVVACQEARTRAAAATPAAARVVARREAATPAAARVVAIQVVAAREAAATRKRLWLSLF
jgi:hypothetical protein